MENIDKIKAIFETYYSLNKKALESKLNEHKIFELQIYATQIGIIPHQNKEKMVKRIAFKIKKRKKK